ncbi:MAG: glycosyl hydrolase family 57, partial [Actinomycetota bacterium]
IRPADLPAIQPALQHRIWSRMTPGDGPGRLVEVIGQLRTEDGRFHMEGGSWTNDISWVRGYDRVLIPMEEASSLFHEQVLAHGIPPDDPRYRRALFHLLTAETSCFRYWGQGVWTDYGAELSRRVADIVTHNF